MKSLKDRTAEYRATIDSFLSPSQQFDPVVRRRSPASNSQALTSSYSEFMHHSSQIFAELQRLSSQLEALTKTTRSRTSLLDDTKRSEFTELHGAVESGLERIKKAICNLGATQKTLPELQHSGGVISSLNSNFTEATKGLSKVLQDREQIELAQRARRDRYSAGISIPANLSLNPTNDKRPLLSDQHHQASTTDQPPEQFSSYQQLSLVQSTDTSYLQARSQDITSIEKSLTHLGQMYAQMSTMIAEQGEIVQRIDANIDDVSFNIDRGHVELLKYYNYVSNNRWLLLKMFVVLIVFMLFFNAFLL